MVVYGLVMKHTFCKEWDKNRFDRAEWNTDKQLIEQRLVAKNAETLAETGELIWEIVEIEVEQG